MQRKEWRLNNDAIVFAEDGRLLNGQHRLSALIQSKTTQTFLVVYGVAESSQLTMDIGQRRNYADHLTMQGIGKNHQALTVALRVLFAYLRAHERCLTNGEFMESYGNAAGKPTFQQLDEVLALAGEGLTHAVSAASSAILRSKTAPALHGSVGAFAVPIYLVREACKDHDRDPKDFEIGVFTGADLGVGDPRLLLRSHTRLTHARRQSGFEVLIYLHTFNCWWEGLTRKTLLIQERGPLIAPLGQLPFALARKPLP
jgi:hypothetical protein